MQVSAGAFGAGVAALGVARMIWGFGMTRSLQTGHVPSQWFVYVLPVALGGWLIMRWLQPREMRPTAQTAWKVARATLLGIALLMPGCAFVANGGHVKGAAYVTALKSDLRNLVSAQERYFAEHKRYSTDLAALQFKPSWGVDAPLVNASATAWSATNTHERLGDIRCGIAVNIAHPITAGSDSGVVCAPLVLPVERGALAFDVVLIIAGFGIAFVAGSNKPAHEQASAI